MKLNLSFIFFFLFPMILFSKDLYEINRKKLEFLSKEIATELKSYNETLKKENKTLGELNTIEFELYNSAFLIKKYERDKISLEKELRSLKEKQFVLGKKIRDQNKVLEKRLPVLAQFGNIGFLEVLLGSASYSDLVRRRLAIESIVSHDLKIFGRQLETHESYKNLSRIYNEKLKDHSNSVIKLNSKKAYLTELRRQKEIILYDISKRKEVYERYLKDMDRAYDKLDDVLKKLEEAHIIEEMQTVKNISIFKGKLPMPLKGKIIKPFGMILDKRTNTELPHRGLTISAENRASIVSIFSGVVLFSDWFSGYGNLIIIDHGKGYVSLYAHLAKRSVKTGDVIELKQSIGSIGNTSIHKESTLYFEIRYQGRAIDPRHWLNHSN